MFLHNLYILPTSCYESSLKKSNDDDDDDNDDLKYIYLHLDLILSVFSLIVLVLDTNKN